MFENGKDVEYSKLSATHQKEEKMSATLSSYYAPQNCFLLLLLLSQLFLPSCSLSISFQKVKVLLYSSEAVGVLAGFCLHKFSSLCHHYHYLVFSLFHFVAVIIYLCLLSQILNIILVRI